MMSSIAVVFQCLSETERDRPLASDVRNSRIALVSGLRDASQAIVCLLAKALHNFTLGHMALEAAKERVTLKLEDQASDTLYVQASATYESSFEAIFQHGHEHWIQRGNDGDYHSMTSITPNVQNANEYWTHCCGVVDRWSATGFQEHKESLVDGFENGLNILMLAQHVMIHNSGALIEKLLEPFVPEEPSKTPITNGVFPKLVPKENVQVIEIEESQQNDTQIAGEAETVEADWADKNDGSDDGGDDDKAGVHCLPPEFVNSALVAAKGITKELDAFVAKLTSAITVADSLLNKLVDRAGANILDDIETNLLPDSQRQVLESNSAVIRMMWKYIENIAKLDQAPDSIFDDMVEHTGRHSDIFTCLQNFVATQHVIAAGGTATPIECYSLMEDGEVVTGTGEHVFAQFVNSVGEKVFDVRVERAIAGWTATILEAKVIVVDIFQPAWFKEAKVEEMVPRLIVKPCWTSLASTVDDMLAKSKFDYPTAEDLVSLPYNVACDLLTTFCEHVEVTAMDVPGALSVDGHCKLSKESALAFLSLVATARDIAIMAARLHKHFLLPTVIDLKPLFSNVLADDVVSGIEALRIRLGDLDFLLHAPRTIALEKEAIQLPMPLGTLRSWHASMGMFSIACVTQTVLSFKQHLIAKVTVAKASVPTWQTWVKPNEFDIPGSQQNLAGVAAKLLGAHDAVWNMLNVMSTACERVMDGKPLGHCELVGSEIKVAKTTLDQLELASCVCQGVDLLVAMWNSPEGPHHARRFVDEFKPRNIEAPACFWDHFEQWGADLKDETPAAAPAQKTVAPWPSAVESPRKKAKFEDDAKKEIKDESSTRARGFRRMRKDT